MTKEIIDFYKQTSEFTYLGKYKDEAIDLWENKCERSLKKFSFSKREMWPPEAGCLHH